MYRVMRGTHDVVVRYEQLVASDAVEYAEGVADNVDVVEIGASATHDKARGGEAMDDEEEGDEAIDDAQAKGYVVVAGSKGNAEDVQVHDGEEVPVGSEEGVQVNETSS
jgi:hypothetical protein